MQKMFDALLRTLETGEPAVLATIVAAHGSTPRDPGTMMAVFPGGAMAGTIGGGNVEFEACRHAGQLLERRENDLRDYRFIQGEGQGGTVTVHFHFLSGRPEEVDAIRRLPRLAEDGKGAWLLRRLEGAAVTAMEAAALGGAKPGLLGRKTIRSGGWLSIPVERPGRLFLFGAGHVAQSLLPVVSRIGFRTLVYDDRPEFARPERFPEAQQVLCAPFDALGGRLTIGPEDYVVVMTSSPQTDCQVLSRVLRSGARYIGCIGSDRKLAICRARLLAEGFTPEEYDTVNAPIGLAIGAETPEEIAVSIAAELIAFRSGTERPGPRPS